MFINSRKAVKSAVASILAVAISLTAVFVGTVNTAAQTENRTPEVYEEDYKTSGNCQQMIGVGEKAHIIQNFSNNENGKAAFTLSNGSSNGHYNFYLTPDSSDFSGGADADFLQFEVNNTSDQRLQIFYVKMVYNVSGVNCELALIPGVKYELYDFNSRCWSEKITDSSTELYGNVPSLSVDSGFYGIVRIPMSAFTCGRYYDDNFILRDNLITKMDFYFQSPGLAGPAEITLDNFMWLSCVNDKSSTVRPINQEPLNFYYQTNIDFVYDAAINVSSVDTFGATDIQFRVTNRTAVDFNIYNLALESNSYVMSLVGGTDYRICDSLGKEWLEKTSVLYNGEFSGITIPAYFSGIVRIPLANFRGEGVISDNIQYNGQTFTSLKFNAALSGITGNVSNIISDFCWVIDESKFYCDGDVNDDKTTNIIDLVKAKKACARMDVSVRTEGFDSDLDGEFTAEDISYLKQLLLCGKEAFKPTLNAESATQLTSVSTATLPLKIDFVTTSESYRIYKTKIKTDGEYGYYVPVKDYCERLGFYVELSDNGARITGKGIVSELLAGSKSVIKNGQIIASFFPVCFRSGVLNADIRTIFTATDIKSEYNTAFGCIYVSTLKSVSAVQAQNGRNLLMIDGKTTTPIMYSGTEGSQNTSLPLVQRQIVNFMNAGINLVQNDQWLSDYWKSDNSIDVATPLNQLSAILETNPNAYLIVRMNVSAPKWWVDSPANADELVGYTQTGSYEGNNDTINSMRTSFASQKWIDEASEKLIIYINALKNSPIGDRVVGFHITGGCFGEWHPYGITGYEPDNGVRMTEAYRAFLADKYGTVSALNSKWRTSYSSFEEIAVPDYKSRFQSEASYRSPVKSQAVIDYYICQSKVISLAVIKFAKLFKDTWQDNILCGTFSGYLYSCDNGGDISVGASASQLDLESLLQSEYIDYISGPYAARDMNNSGLFRSLALSASLNGKLFISEMDMHTYLGDGFNHTYPRACRDERDTIAIMRRNYMYTLTEAAGQWYYDFGPNNASGAYDTDNLMAEVKSLKAISDKYSAVSYSSDADVLVVYDLYSYVNMLPWTHDRLATNLIDSFTEALLKTGASSDRIFLFDLKKVDLSKYKTVIFANTSEFTEEERSYIKSNVMTSGRSVVFMSGAGYYRLGTKNFGNIYDLVGMNIAQDYTDSNISLTFKNGLNGSSTLSGIHSMFRIEDSSVTAVATYSNGKTAAGYKTIGGCKVWYFGVPIVDSKVLTAVLKDSGSHIYVSGIDDAFVSIGGGIIGIYTLSGGTAQVKLKNDKSMSVTIPDVNTVFIDSSTGELLTKTIS